MQLWNVILETQVVVVAETLEDAGFAAEEAVKDAAFTDGDGLTVQTVHPFRSVPDGWGEDCIPWGADDDDERRDWTIAEWLGAAEAEAEEGKQADGDVAASAAQIALFEGAGNGVGEAAGSEG